MYRYLLFAYRSYEESGGIKDLVLTFNTVEELQEAIKEYALENVLINWTERKDEVLDLNWED